LSGTITHAADARRRAAQAPAKQRDCVWPGVNNGPAPRTNLHHAGHARIPLLEDVGGRDHLGSASPIRFEHPFTARRRVRYAARCASTGACKPLLAMA
jgi:hypothetical protein